MTLADELKRVRAQRGLDPAQVAGKAGVSEKDLRRLKAGGDDVKLASGVKISRALWGQIEFVHDSILRIIDEVIAGDDIEQEQVSTHFELSNGFVVGNGTSLSPSRLFGAFGEGLSARGISAGMGIASAVICGALKELALKVDHYPPAG